MRLRIGLLIYGSLETLSGGYLYDRLLVDYLREQGHTVTIVSVPWQNYVRHLGHNFAPALRHALATADFDLLLQDELNHPSLVWLNQWLRGRVRYPLISIVHHLRCSELRPPWQNAIYRPIERRYLRSVDGFIFNSATTKQTVEALIGRLPPHTIAYPAGDRFPEAAEASQNLAHKLERHGPLRLLFVGNIIPRKGLHTLLNALERAQLPNWKLDIVGSGEVNPYYTLAMQRQVAQNRWQRQVRFWGALNHAELAERFAAAHLLIVPSSYEGFGIVYLEAMSFGVPAIATTAGAAHEIITHGRDGYLIRPDDAAQLADLLRQLYHDKPRLLQLSRYARARYTTHPTWAETGATIEQFLGEVVRHS